MENNSNTIAALGGAPAIYLQRQDAQQYGSESSGLKPKAPDYSQTRGQIGHQYAIASRLYLIRSLLVRGSTVRRFEDSRNVLLLFFKGLFIHRDAFSCLSSSKLAKPIIIGNPPKKTEKIKTLYLSTDPIRLLSGHIYSQKLSHFYLYGMVTYDS